MSRLKELEEQLKNLKSEEFMLQMCDHWSSEDYRYHDKLCEKIKNIEEEIKNEKSI